ncbi:TPM domain-containing protein [Actinomycetes bacterium KLBMP 9759]
MRRLSTIAAVLAVLFIAGAGAALAEPPLRAEETVTDRTGVLEAGLPRIDEAIDKLSAERGYDLYVVFVRSFDDAGGQDWADESARLSQLGDADVLMAVAVDDRAYGVSVSNNLPISQTALDDLRSENVEPLLKQGDWTGAVVALADGLRTGGGNGNALGIGVAVVGGVAVIGGGAYLLSRRRKSAAQPGGPGPKGTAPAPGGEFADVSTDELGYRSAQALLDVDDAVRTSETELSAARTHFGEAAVAEFTAALEQSRADMLRGFGLRQQLDDEVAEDEPTRRSMLIEIIRACRSADERLDAQVAAFDRLRDLEAKAPEYIEGLGARLVAVSARLPQVEAQWTALRQRYAPSALDAVAGNLDQSGKLLDAASTEVAEARAELAARAAGAVVSGRAAEDAITQAETLLDGIPRLEGELVEAAGRIAGARAEAEQDLAEARAMDSPDLAPVVARAEAALAAAKAAEESPIPDPLAALRLITEAGAALDKGIAQARDAQARVRRASEALEKALVTARSSVAAAADFIATRRGAVGIDARTRLAEAQRRLQVAESSGDPESALGEAQAAERYARQALEIAQSEVSTWSAPGGGVGGDVMVDLGSLILGGIIAGSRGGIGGGGGGSRRSPGSFGGSSSRGRRGFGGRF